MTGIDVPDLALSCWVIEAARSKVLGERGHSESSVRAAERARTLARVCAAESRKIQPRLAGEHADWMGRVAGSDAETGALGRVFLQRLGMYVDAFMRDRMPEADHQRMLQLSARDLDEVNEALSVQGLPQIAEDDWPPAPDPPRGDGSDGGGDAGPPDGADPARPSRKVARFAILADPHIEPGDNAHVEHAIEMINEAGVEFTVVPGDLTKDGSAECYLKAAQLFSEAKAAVHCSLGNHDMAASSQAQAAETPPAAATRTETVEGSVPGPARFEAQFGTKPYGAYESGGVRVILLDSAVPAVSQFPPFDIMGGDFTDAPAGSVDWGDFSDEMSEWMAQVGPSTQPTFVLLHHPPYPYPGFPPLLFGLTAEATEKLARLVEATSAEAVFCGHTHRSARRLFEGIPVIEVPSIRHWPMCFGMVEVVEDAERQGRSWSFDLWPVPERPGRARDHASYLFRRYVAGDKTGQTFSSGRGT